MEFLREALVNFLPFVIQNSSLIIFLVAFLIGEEAVLFVSIVASQGLFNIWQVYFLSFMGLILIDSIWFFVGSSRLFSKISNYGIIRHGYVRVERFLNMFAHKNMFLFMFASKFITGIRIVGTIYLGNKKVKYLKFLLYDIITVLSSLAIIVLVGWWAGKGFGKILSIYKRAEWFLLFIIVIYIIIYFGEKLVNKKLDKKPKKNKGR